MRGGERGGGKVFDPHTTPVTANENLSEPQRVVWYTRGTTSPPPPSRTRRRLSPPATLSQGSSVCAQPNFQHATRTKRLREDGKEREISNNARRRPLLLRCPFLFFASLLPPPPSPLPPICACVIFGRGVLNPSHFVRWSDAYLAPAHSTPKQLPFPSSLPVSMSFCVVVYFFVCPGEGRGLHCLWWLC